MPKQSSKRGGTQGSTSLPALSRGGASVRTGDRQGSSHPTASQTRGKARVWAFRPDSRRNQIGLTNLFADQTRLKNRLVVQARLARLDVSEVRSTEAEHLRMVNQAILDVSSHVEGFSNPFRERNLIASQLITEEMISRQGVREFQSEGWTPATPTSSRPFRSRRKWAPLDERPVMLTRPADWFSLQGPLVRYYRRAVERGYLGSPESWIRGPKAVALSEKLSRKGFTLPPPERWNVHDFLSPLRWALNRCSAQEEISSHHGFTGETIRRKATNVVVLRRQAASVQRLRLSDWPCGETPQVQSWPTYPTLGESWTMARRGKLPAHHGIDPVRANLISAERIPTRWVKPSYSARVVSNLVIGVRADIEVPRKFLGYFGYRWGFLILRRSIGCLPHGLVKHLVGIWKTDYTGLFLRSPIRYNEALRRIPHSREPVLCGFVRARGNSSDTKKKRGRHGKNERLLYLVRKSIPYRSFSGSGSPSSDKSDDGVRLC